MKKKNQGVPFPIGRFPSVGITSYLKNGKVVYRPSSSKQKRSNTRPQFAQRQRMRHTIALWKMLKQGCDTLMFTQHTTAYNGFVSLANRLPAVFIPKDPSLKDASLLMPDIPVSDGTLPTIKQQLGKVEGTPALLTNLQSSDIRHPAKLLLYTAVQRIENGMPRVKFTMREMEKPDFVVVDGFLALVDEDFANENKGWALVRVIKERCSTQGLVTRCTYYEQFTTEEAMQNAAKTYGGINEYAFLDPRSSMY